MNVVTLSLSGIIQWKVGASQNYSFKYCAPWNYTHSRHKIGIFASKISILSWPRFKFLFKFFFSCKWFGNHPEEDLATFGYMPKRKVDLKKPCYILVTCENLWSKCGNFNFFSLKNGNFGPFFLEISFAQVGAPFFCHQVSKIRQKIIVEILDLYPVNCFLAFCFANFLPQKIDFNLY